MNKFTFASRSVVFVVFTAMVWGWVSNVNAQSRPPARPPARPPVIAPRPTVPGAKQLPPTPRISPPRTVTTTPSFTSRVKSFFGKGASAHRERTPPEPTLIGQANMYDFRESSSPVAAKYPGGKDAIFQALPDFRAGTPPASSKYSDSGGKDAIFGKLPDFSKGPPPSIANTRERIFQPLPKPPNGVSSAPNVGIVSVKTPMLAVQGAKSSSNPNPPNPVMGSLPPPPAKSGGSEIVYEKLLPSVVYSKLPNDGKPLQKVNKGNVELVLRNALQRPDNPAASPPPKPPLPEFLRK